MWTPTHYSNIFHVHEVRNLSLWHMYLCNVHHLLHPDMYESSGSQFFRTTNGIQSERDALDVSRLVMTFLTILAVKKYYASSKISSRRKNTKRYVVIKIGVFRRSSGKFCFIRCRRQHLLAVE